MSLTSYLGEYSPPQIPISQFLRVNPNLFLEETPITMKKLTLLTLILGIVPQLNAETLEVRVSDGLDDAEEHLTEGNAIDITSSDLELGAEDGGTDTQEIGIRFRDITVPASTTINSASIQFTVDEADDEETSVLILGELSANASELSDCCRRHHRPRANHRLC